MVTEIVGFGMIFLGFALAIWISFRCGKTEAEWQAACRSAPEGHWTCVSCYQHNPDTNDHCKCGLHIDFTGLPG